MNSRYLYTLLFCGSFLFGKAQTESTLSSMRRVYQSTYINPSFIPKYKLSIGIPILSNININNSRSGLSLSDMVDCIDNEGLLDLNKMYTKIDGGGYSIQTTFQTDMFHISFPIGRVQVGINSSLKTQNNQTIDKDFIGFLANGNAYFAGQTVSVGVLDVSSMAYLENGVSVARQFNRLSVGVRAKYLQGLYAIDTKDLGLDVTTSVNPYDTMTIRTRGSLRTAGVPLFVDSLTGQQKNDELKNFDPSNIFSNSGLGFDIGASYQITSDLLVHASVVDLGGINWKAAAYNYELIGQDANFAGFTREQFNSDSARSAYTDSLTKIMYQTNVSEKSFTTKLATRYYAGVDYNLTRRDRVGFLFQGQQLPSRFVSAYTVSYARKFGTNWDVTTNYTMYNKEYSLVGLGTAIKMGPVQLYLVTDNLLVFFLPQNSNNFSFRMGINLVWSENKGSHISSGE
jgi:hypothetical protein